MMKFCAYKKLSRYCYFNIGIFECKIIIMIIMIIERERELFVFHHIGYFFFINLIPNEHNDIQNNMQIYF